MLNKIKSILHPKMEPLTKSRVQKGQSLVEMAITAPILIFMLIGLFEVGFAIRSYVVLVNVNREITRFSVRPGYLDFSDQSTVNAGYAKVRDWVFTSLTGQLQMDFDDTDGNATLIISHMVADTGYPCDPDDDIKNCKCDKFNPDDSTYDPNYAFHLDDRIYHPDQADQAYQAQTFGPTSTSTGSRETRLDYEQIARELVDQNNFFNCQILKKGGIPSANNVIFTELFLDQPQLFGFPLISNPLTDPVPLYTHTGMRLVCAARSTGAADNNLSCGVDNDGPACEVYPFTFDEDTFEPDPDAFIGQQFDAFEGTAPGDFGWLGWNPAENDAVYVENEIHYPQMSRTDFTDVNEPDDHELSIGDDVAPKTGVANSDGIDEQLELLVYPKKDWIIVPVYDENIGTGSKSYFTITHFAKIRIDQICLPRNGQTCDGQNAKQIKATFLGYVDDLCGAD